MEIVVVAWNLPACTKERELRSFLHRQGLSRDLKWVSKPKHGKAKLGYMCFRAARAACAAVQNKMFHCADGSCSLVTLTLGSRNSVRVQDPPAFEEQLARPQACRTLAEPQRSERSPLQDGIPKVRMMCDDAAGLYSLAYPVAYAWEADVDFRVCPCTGACCCVKVPEIEEKKGLQLCATPCRKRKAWWRQRKELARKCAWLRRKSASHLERLKGVEEELREAIQERGCIAAACANAFDEVEAAMTRLLSAAHVQVSPPTDADLTLPWWARCLHEFKHQATSGAAALLPPLLRSEKAIEELGRILTCPISHDIIRQPVFAPDGHVYEEAHIRRWLNMKPSSPMTDTPMRPSELLRARVVEQAANAWWALLGQERPVEELEAELSEEVPSNDTAPYEEPQLLVAIMDRDEARALQLLQESTVDGLNYRFGEQQATVLHHALINCLPAVALAIIEHPAFDMPRAMMGRRECVTAIHIAAAFGNLPVCKAMVRRFGPRILADLVEKSVVLDLPEGGELILHRGHSVFEITQLYCHDGLYHLFREAAAAYLAGA